MATNNPKEYKAKFTLNELSCFESCSSTLSIGERQFRIQHCTTSKGILGFYVLLMNPNKWLTGCEKYRDIRISITINSDNVHTKMVKILNVSEFQVDTWHLVAEFFISNSNIGVNKQKLSSFLDGGQFSVSLKNTSGMLSMILDKNYMKSSPFASLHDDISLTDFELRCESGSIPVHRVVLAIASPVLKTFLESKNNWLENHWFKFSETDMSTLQHLKDYIYLGVLPEEGLENLLLLASSYMMEDLKDQCISKILAKVTPENAFEISEFAVTNKMTELYVKFLKKVQDGTVKVDGIPFV